jgi:hypothetical protein
LTVSCWSLTTKFANFERPVSSNADICIPLQDELKAESSVAIVDNSMQIKADFMMASA